MIVKKHFGADLEKKKKSYLAIGLLFSLAMVLAAFEYRTLETLPISMGEAPIGIDIVDVIPVSIPKPPPPPPPPPPTAEIKVVENNATIKNVIEVFIPEVTLDTKINFEMPVFDEPEDDEPEEKIFRIVEKKPKFPGGIEALYKYIGSNIKYPAMAKDSGIKGTVHITFVVEKDGSITDVKLLRRIGGGCDEEAIRVIGEMPNWNPGKQRGKPVRVQFNLPISFKLR